MLAISNASSSVFVCRYADVRRKNQAPISNRITPSVPSLVEIYLQPPSNITIFERNTNKLSQYLLGLPDVELSNSPAKPGTAFWLSDVSERVNSLLQIVIIHRLWTGDMFAGTESLFLDLQVCGSSEWQWIMEGGGKSRANTNHNHNLPLVD
jgi:hypothetical protein